MNNQISLRPSLIFAALCVTIAAPGCKDAASTEDTSSTTAVSGEDGYDTEGPDDLCAGWRMWAELEGAASPLDSCESITFTGELIEQVDAGTWALDSCPCDADCDAPDPYELRIGFFDGPGPELPPLPACPQIELQRNESCQITALVIRDLSSANTPQWWASHHAELATGFEWLQTQLYGEQTCAPGVTGHGVHFDAGDSGVDIVPGGAGQLTSTPLGAVNIWLGQARSYTEGEPAQGPLSYIAIVQ
jgi:hypothetical protein